MTSASRPRWSALIPVHNCADYLAEALPEVIAQLGDRSDAEIIVVDDASTDDPGRVVEQLGQGRVHYRPNPEHLGAVGTFNRCLALATGELVHLLHGDDLVLPGFYAAMESALDDPAVVAAVCRVRDVDSDGAPTYVTKSYRAGTGVWTDALEKIAVSNRVRAPGIVVRRTAYEQVGGYRNDLPHAADWEMWTRLAAHGPIVFVDQVLACYRRHGSSDTSARLRTGANVRERITAIGVLVGHVAPDRRTAVMRRALAYSTVFATRTAVSMAKAGNWPAAAQQAREAARAAYLVRRGLRVHTQDGAAVHPQAVTIDPIATVGHPNEEGDLVAEQPSVTDLLSEVRTELRITRTIPSTGIVLRQRAVDQGVEYILSDSRFDDVQITLNNASTIATALTEVTLDGMVAEFGVYKGTSLTQIAKFFPDRTVHGFDSFVGLPSAWGGTSKGAGAFDIGAQPPQLPVSNLEFHVGWFDDTVPPFAREHSGPFAFAHLDADLYSSTKTVFDNLGKWFVPGTVVVFDEYFGYHGWQRHEHQAFQEFLSASGLSFRAISLGHMNLAVRLTDG